MAQKIICAQPNSFCYNVIYESKVCYANKNVTDLFNKFIALLMSLTKGELPTSWPYWKQSEFYVESFIGLERWDIITNSVVKLFVGYRVIE